MQWEGWVAAVVLGLFAGIGAGWGLSLHLLRKNFESRLRRAIEGSRQQHLANADKLRADRGVAQTELELLRTTVQRQISAAIAEPRAAAARLEDRLRIAYEELDRLRQQINGPSPVVQSAHSDGFAVTQPWEGPAVASTRRS